MVWVRSTLIPEAVSIAVAVWFSVSVAVADEAAQPPATAPETHQAPAAPATPTTPAGGATAADPGAVPPADGTAADPAPAARKVRRGPREKEAEGTQAPNRFETDT